MSSSVKIFLARTGFSVFDSFAAAAIEPCEFVEVAGVVEGEQEDDGDVWAAARAYTIEATRSTIEHREILLTAETATITLMLGRGDRVQKMTEVSGCTSPLGHETFHTALDVITITLKES